MLNMSHFRGRCLGGKAKLYILLLAALLGGCQEQGLIGFAPGAKHLLSWRRDQAELPVLWQGYTGLHFYDVELWYHGYVGVSSAERPNDIQWIE